MRTPEPLPDALPPQFRTRDALEAGLPPHRLRARDLDSSLHGLRHAGERAADLLERCRMLRLRIPQTAFFSHSTAALLWGAPLPWALESERRLHVAVPAPHARLHSRDVVGHRLDVRAGEVTVWAGLPVSSPARTWLDLATQLELGDLVAVGDYLINARAPFASRMDLAVLLGKSTGVRGVQLARRALELLSDRAESRPESLLRVILVTGGLSVPDVNHTLVDSDTGRHVRPDLIFRAERLIIEYQGDYHRTRAQWRKDMTRRSRLEARGWRVMEVGADDLRDPRELVARVRARLDAEV